MASKSPKFDPATPAALKAQKSRVTKPAALAPDTMPVPFVTSEPAPVPFVEPVATPTAMIAEAPAIAADTLPAAPVPAASLQKEDIMDTIDNAANAATDTVETAADRGQAMFNETTDRAKSAVEKSTKLFADLNDFSKGNLEAVVESSKIAAKGAEDIARYTSDYARATVEKANANARQLAAVKSPTELFKLQGDFAREAMDSAMAETAKFAEGYLKLLGEIAQPISNRVAVAAEKMKLAA